jgi:ribosomal RNA-processing protein 12
VANPVRFPTELERIRHLTMFHSQSISESLVGETLLCLKDSNAKTRDAAYSLLLTVAKVHGDSVAFIRVVTAAIGSKSPHMRSAAVTALSRLVFELSSDDVDVQNTLPMLLTTVLLLSDDPSREVTKSMVVFVRVSISAATPEQLQPLLPDILKGLLKYHRGKDRFRAKIKIIIKKLVKMFGFDMLTPHVPPSDTRLLTHMRKLSERERRRKDARFVQRREAMEYDAMVDSDEEDSDDGNTLVTGMTRQSKFSRVTSGSGKQSLKRRKTDRPSVVRSKHAGRIAGATERLKNDQDGIVLDVKELTSRAVRFGESEGEDSDSQGDLEYDASGKLLVPDVDDTFATVNTNERDTMVSSKIQRSTTTSTGARDTATNKRNAKAPPAKLGSRYKAKKAGGDMKKKGQTYEPYAYVQLDGRNYTKKNRRQALEQMDSVVQRGKKRSRR